MSFLSVATEMEFPRVVKEVNEAISVGLFTSSFPFFLSYSKIPFRISIDYSTNNISKFVSLLYYIYFTSRIEQPERILLDTIVPHNNGYSISFHYFHNEKVQSKDDSLERVERFKQRFFLSFQKWKNLHTFQYLLYSIPVTTISYITIKTNRDKLKEMIPSKTISVLLDALGERVHHDYYMIHSKVSSTLLLFIESIEQTITQFNKIVNIFGEKSLLLYEPVEKLDLHKIEALVRFREDYSFPDRMIECHIGSSIFIFLTKTITQKEGELERIRKRFYQIQRANSMNEEVEIPFVLLSKTSDFLTELASIFMNYNKSKLRETYLFTRKGLTIGEHRYVRYGKEGEREHQIYWIPFLFNGRLEEDVYKKWLDIQQDWNSLQWNTFNHSNLQIDRYYRIQITDTDEKNIIRYLLIEALETWNIRYHKIIKRDRSYIIDGVVENNYDVYRTNYTKIMDWVFQVRLPEVERNKLSFIYIPNQTIFLLHFIYKWIIKKELLDTVVGCITYIVEKDQVVLFGYFDRENEYYINIANPILEKQRSISVTFLDGKTCLLEECIDGLQQHTIYLSSSDHYRFENVLRSNLHNEQVQIVMKIVPFQKGYHLYRNLGLSRKPNGLYEDILVVDKKTGRVTLLCSLPNKIYEILDGKRIDTELLIKRVFELWRQERLLNRLAYGFYKELQMIPRMLLYCKNTELHVDKKLWDSLSIRRQKEKIVKLFNVLQN